MTGRSVPVLTVDFNNDDDDDLIRALRKRARYPEDLEIGQQLRLEDEEGNACLGTVVKLDEKSVWVKADYGTWIDGSPVLVLVADDALDEALARQARFITRNSSTTV